MIDRIIAFLKSKFPENSIRKQLVKDSTWSTIAILIDRGATLVSFIIAGKLLSKSSFGELGLLYSTVGMVGLFAGFGLNTTTTKYVAEYKNQDKRKVGRIITIVLLVSLGLSLLGTIILFAGANFVADNLFNASHLELSIKIAALFMFFEAMYNAQQGILIGYQKFTFLFISNLVKGSLSLIMVFIGVYYYGVEGAMAGFAISSLVAWVTQDLLIHKANKEWDVSFVTKGLSKEVNILYQFSLPAFLSSAMVAPATWGSRTLLANVANGYEELGVFTAASKFQSGLNRIGMALGYTLIPFLTSPKHDDNEKLKRANVLVTWVLGIIPAVPIILFPETLSLVFGDKYAGSDEYTTLVIVMAFTIVALYNQGLGRVLIAEDMMWWGVLTNGIWGSLLVSCTFFLREYGAIGIALAYLIAYSINTIIFFPLYIKKNLVPRDTLLSQQAGLIWALILIIVLVHFLDLSYLIRSCIVISVLPILYIFIKKLTSID